MKKNRWMAWIFDLICLGFLVAWLAGWGHAPDVRRALILFAVFGAFSRTIVTHSRFLSFFYLFWRRLFLRSFRWKVFFAFFFFALGISILQALALRFALYDVGIFHQILWSLTNGESFHSTISGAGDFLKDHLAPSLGLLAPFFWLSGGSPLFLPIVHTILIFTGIGAWIFFAERIANLSPELRSRLAAGTLVFGVSFGSLWANQRWGFHENSIFFASFSWAIVILFLKRKWSVFWALVLVVISAGTKEIVLVNIVLFFILWSILLIRKNGWRGRAVVPLLGAFFLLTIFIYFESLPKPADKNYFVRYYSYLGSNFSDFLWAMLFSPWRVFQEIGLKEILSYCFAIFIPFLAFPLIYAVRRLRKNPRSRKFPTPAWMLVVTPSFFSALMATYPPLRDPGFHYVLELWPILAIFTIIALADLKAKNWVWIWALSSVFLLKADPVQSLRDFFPQALAMKNVRQEIALIPEKDSVVASELAGTWVAGRKTVLRWPDRRFLKGKCPDWFILRENHSYPFHFSTCFQGRPGPIWRSQGWVGYRVR